MHRTKVMFIWITLSDKWKIRFLSSLRPPTHLRVRQGRLLVLRCGPRP